MENNKEIGKLFKEKLNSLEAIPKDSGWNEIQKELDKKKKKRRFLIPFWFNYTGLFLAGIIISSFVYQNSSKIKNLNFYDSKIEEKVVEVDNTKTIKPEKNPKTISSESTNYENINKNDSKLSKNLVQNDNLVTSEKSKKSESKKINSNKTTETKNTRNSSNNYIVYSKNNSKNQQSLKNKKEQKKLNSSNENQKEAIELNKISDENKIQNQDSKYENTNSIASKNTTEKIAITNEIEAGKDSITKKKQKKQIEKNISKDSLKIEKKPNSNFTIFTFISPTLSVFNSNKSLLDSRLDSNSKNAEIGLSYGAYLCLNGAEKFSFRIGIAKNNLKLATKNVILNTYNYSEINYATGFSNAFIYSQSNNSEFTNSIQDITYIEVPLEAKYKFVDKKFGINAIAGFSYLFLDKNEVFFETPNGAKYKVGATRDLLKQSFGLTIGLGLDYKITKKLKFNLEPMLKYNLKSNQNSTYSNPFTINILTGLEYRFGK